MAEIIERAVLFPEVEARTGKRRSTINELEKSGQFPPRRRIGNRVCWLESELVAYLRALPSGLVSRPRFKRDADGNLIGA